MRERKTGRLLALLLVAALLLSLLPATVLAVEPGASTTGNGDSFMRIVHLDCGRKYFTVEWVKSLIDKMDEYGYTHLELAFGNDGLRFLLDDMSVTVGGTTYKSEKVTNAIKAGNTAYTTASTGEWTQTQMDGIISYAQEKGISIIPLLNTPGHMNAIVSAMGQLGISNAGFTPAGYTTSKNTINLENSPAVAFTQALVKKYVDYFKSKNCDYFNLGADEYANDSLEHYSGMGFGYLSDNNLYSKFVTYVDTLADYVIEKRMTPIVFNDGVCYNQNTSSMISTDVLVSYWSSGWFGYNVAPSSFLSNNGYSLINTNGAYYYVLHKNDTNVNDLKSTIQNTPFSNTTFMDGEVSNPAGSMFCIWCDFPGTATEEKIYDDVVTGGILSSMATAMKDKTTTPPTGPEPGYTREETISLAVGDTFSVTVKGDNLSGETDDPNPPGYVNVKVTYTPGEIITADGYWERVTEGIAGIVSGQEYLIIANEESDGKDGGHILTTTGGTETINAAKDAKISNNTVDTKHQFIITESGDGYTLKGKNNNYLYPDASHHFWGWDYSLKSNQSTPKVVSINANEKGTFHIVRDVQDDGETTTTALNYKEPWIGSPEINASENGHPFFLYRYVPGAATQEPGTNTITFTGVKAGETSVVIGDTKYTIKVTPESLVGVEDLTIEYWITNKQVQDGDGHTSMTISASDAFDEDGILLSELVPQICWSDTNEMVFWKLTRLTSGNHQVIQGADQTLNGDDFEYVRYWGNQWSFSVDGNEWTTINETDQIVAYYLQKTDVTAEITTNVVDWGQTYSEWEEGIDNRWFWDGYVENGSKFVFLDFAVVYEDNTQNPSSFPDPDTLFYHFDGNSAQNPRVLGAISFTENSEFEIWKITTQNGTCRGYQDVDRFNPTYSGEETILWHENMGGEPHIDQLKFYQNRSGQLIRIYVRAKVTEDSLTVHYVDNTTSQDFYSYNIAVASGTTFKEGIALNDPWKGILLNGDVKNIKDVTQYVTADLTQMTEIGAQYRYSDYTCTEVTRSTDGKDVFLYYTFKDSHSYVIDFGLPLEVSLNISGDWTSATLSGEKYGTATFSDGTLRYTPNKVLLQNEMLTLELTSASGEKATHIIYIYPASNVLYEETFLTVATNMGTDYAPWTHNGNAATPAQSADQTSLYGYDAAYEDSTGNSMGSSWTISGLTKGNGSKYLTTTFYGNAFDLIGTAGPDTGFVYLMLTGPENRMVIIDTSYVDAKRTTLYQVPLAHEVLKEGEYTAYIRGTYRAATDGSSDAASKSAASTFSLMSASSPLDEVYEVLAEFERDGFVIDDIEFVSVDENSVLSESADAQVSLFSMPANNTETTAAKSAPARPEGTTVTIDGFRVYREAIDSNFADAYKQADENNFKYINILKATLTGDNGSDFPSFAYVEGSGGEYIQATYEASGGPQNELYLKPGSGVVIYVDGNGAAQFSARAVTNSCAFTVSVVDGQTNSYTAVHNTELYYAAPGTGVITVVNNSKTDMLALGNLKVLGGATVRTLSAEDVQAACLMLASAFPVDPGEPEEPVEPETPAVFEPAKLDVKVNSTKVLFNKLVTVTVSASADVDKLTINGKTLYPTNSLLVQWGLSKTYTYIYVDTVKRTESKSYDIVAYNDAGLASAPVTVQG